MTIDQNTTVISFEGRSYIAVVTTTYDTTSVSQTVTNNSCNTSTNYLITYTTSPTTYQKQTYTYTATSTGMNILEFGFKAVNQVKTWHLDDVSLIDKNASNSEMLVNGGFENGSLVGWQILCSSINCGTIAGNITQSNCHTGSYCYEGMCRNAYDFLRQTILVTSGHIYILSFWLYTDGHNAQAAYVNIS
ncbi:unnamed protein product [Rotaria sp. Silwood1]|nr:unnamed protein product [Rotaria sp. Silwood1]CAF3627016.1 unnamed protein product [Rotaria sp. Silwood1]CAF3656522.1 unnamed protein product [Rotaria sp. Silwood1]CAF4640086.1 unnamed protein product [Rotaria sp. Silwood1]